MSATESAKKNARCANVGGLCSVGGVSSWVRGSNTFWRGSKFPGVGQNILAWDKYFLAGSNLFWRGSFFFYFFLKVGQNLLGVNQNFFGVGQIVRIADLDFL